MGQGFARVGNPLLVYGRSALLFYLAHLFPRKFYPFALPDSPALFAKNKERDSLRTVFQVEYDQHQYYCSEYGDKHQNPSESSRPQLFRICVHAVKHCQGLRDE